METETAETAETVETVEVKIDPESGELVTPAAPAAPAAAPSPAAAPDEIFDKYNPDNEHDAFATLNDKGIHRLLVGENGIIRQAVDDVRSLVKAGVVAEGKLAVSSMPRKVCDGMTIPEVKDTLGFFRDDNIGLILRLGGINIEPKRFRGKLGFAA